MTIVAIKSLLAALLALTLIAATRRSRASVRHLLLAAFFAFLLLLPVVQHFAPQLPIPVTDAGTTSPADVVIREAVAVTASAIASTSDAAAAQHWTLRSMLLAAWGAGVVLLFARLLIGIIRLRRLAARGAVWLEGTTLMNEVALEAGIRRSSLVVRSDEVAVPLTFGFSRSTIVLPQAADSWGAGELTSALRHELEHVRRDDWALQILARAAASLYWPNPLVWVALRRFFVEAERACDDAVVASGRDADAYAGQLVALARRVSRLHALPALAMASPSKLALRVRAVLDPSQPRGPHGAYVGVTTAALTIALLVTLAPARLVAAVSETAASYTSTDSLLGEALINAAESGDIQGIERILGTGVDVNMVVVGDGTALIGAIRGGHRHVIDFLLERGADVNVVSPGDGSPLIAAAASGSTEVVTMLLDRGADVNVIVPGDENPLMNAARQGHEEVLRLLIDRGADVNATAVEGTRVRTALGLAEQAGHAHIVRLLRAAGAVR